jgi:hypothetical protein
MLKRILKILFLIGYIALLVLVAVKTAGAGGEIEFPDNYYNRPSIAAMWLDGHTLHAALSNISWNVPYQYGWFDCTERAFLMEFLAENAGYHAVVGCGSGHCWLLVEYGWGWRAYDSMTFGVSQNRSRYYPRTYPSEYHPYNPAYTYEDVYDYAPWEVDWWNVVDWGNPFSLDIRLTQPPRSMWREE